MNDLLLLLVLRQLCDHSLDAIFLWSLDVEIDQIDDSLVGKIIIDHLGRILHGNDNAMPAICSMLVTSLKSHKLQSVS